MPQGTARPERARAARLHGARGRLPAARARHGLVAAWAAALDVDGERERLEAALEPQIESGRVELHWLEDVSWEGCTTSSSSGQWHVLHFIGHGTYDTDTDEGVLAFVGRDGRADYVTASSLADLLDEAEPTPRLVVLNSCQSGAGGTTDLFSGTAAALAHSGIRAVAAMQFSISDTAALAFARGFYTALAYGRGIDEAMRSGRIGILGMGRGTLEWVTPVLYLRGEGARLFDVVPVESTRDATDCRRMPSAEARRRPRHPCAADPDAADDASLAAGWRSSSVIVAVAALAVGGGDRRAFALRPTDGGGGAARTTGARRAPPNSPCR